MAAIPQDKLKDVLISKTATKLSCSEDTVDKVIGFQFKEAKDAFKQYSEVEISGFGKFTISQPKVRRKLRRMMDLHELTIGRMVREDETLTERRRSSFLSKISKLKEAIDHLKTKLI